MHSAKQVRGSENFLCKNPNIPDEDVFLNSSENSETF